MGFNMDFKHAFSAWISTCFLVWFSRMLFWYGFPTCFLARFLNMLLSMVLKHVFEHGFEACLFKHVEVCFLARFVSMLFGMVSQHAF